MRRLIVTRADIGKTDYLVNTLPIIIKYAYKCEADFKVLDESHGPVFQRILSIYKFFDTYDRVVHLDSDMVITESCPNIFNVVPEDTIGLVFEDKGSRLTNRRSRITEIKKGYGGNDDWTSGYFNAGILVTSRVHREIFTRVNGKFWGEGMGRKARAMGADQTHVGYQIMKQGHKYVDLGYKWNHMSMFSEEWNGSKSRFDSHIIHYAGKARFPDKGERSRTQLMIDDIKKIYND